MITIITGTPGAGKTLYSIEKLLLPIVGKTVKGRDENGVEVEHPRTIYTNINGLQIDHELIDGGDNQGLKDWHKWVKPGAMIVFDEVQKVWPRTPNGSKIPDDIQELDTHRHKGVDFILITQTVMNVSSHIHGLVGRHLHVRRVGNMKASIVYEWDHCSKSLQYSKSISKAPYRFGSKVFKLYKSAELHTKVKRSVPTLVWFILAGVCIAAWGGPTYFQRMKEKTQGGAVAAQKQEQKHVSPTPTNDPAKPLEVGSSQSLAQAAVAAPVEPEKPVLAGCIASAAQCVCYTDKAEQIELEPGQCQQKTGPSKVILAGGGVDWYPDPKPPRREEPAQWTGSVIGTEKGWRF